MQRVKRNKHKTWKCENNGEIVFTYSEALAKGYSRQQFVNGIDELQAKGFIDITHQGTGGRKPNNGAGDYTTYWIDDRWEDYGTDDFKPARNPRKKDTRKGQGFGYIWDDPEKSKAMLEKIRKGKGKKQL